MRSATPARAGALVAGQRRASPKSVAALWAPFPWLGALAVRHRADRRGIRRLMAVGVGVSAGAFAACRRTRRSSRRRGGWPCRWWPSTNCSYMMRTAARATDHRLSPGPEPARRLMKPAVGPRLADDRVDQLAGDHQAQVEALTSAWWTGRHGSPVGRRSLLGDLGTRSRFPRRGCNRSSTEAHQRQALAGRQADSCRKLSAPPLGVGGRRLPRRTSASVRTASRSCFGRAA